MSGGATEDLSCVAATQSLIGDRRRITLYKGPFKLIRDDIWTNIL